VIGHAIHTDIQINGSKLV